MNTQPIRMAALVLAAGLSGAAAVVPNVAFAVAVSGQGTWETTLQGRDLDGNLATFEAYYDNTLNITWLADANYAQTSGYDADGRMTWVDANTWVVNLGFYNPLTNQTYTDWRLSSVEPINGSTFNYNWSYNGSTDRGYNITSPQSEMAHLFYVTLGNPSSYTSAAMQSGCYVNGSNTCLDNVGPFSNLQASIYWSATEYAPITGTAWIFGMDYGVQNGGYTPNDFYALAVSPGDVVITGVPVAVPEGGYVDADAGGSGAGGLRGAPSVAANG